MVGIVLETWTDGTASRDSEAVQFMLPEGLYRATRPPIALSILLQAGIVLAPPAHEIFGVTSLHPEHWLLSFGIGIMPVITMEIWKAVRAHASRLSMTI